MGQARSLLREGNGDHGRLDFYPLVKNGGLFVISRQTSGQEDFLVQIYKVLFDAPVQLLCQEHDEMETASTGSLSRWKMLHRLFKK
jgi:hypothetical protein